MSLLCSVNAAEVLQTCSLSHFSSSLMRFGCIIADQSTRGASLFHHIFSSYQRCRRHGLCIAFTRGVDLLHCDSIDLRMICVSPARLYSRWLMPMSTKWHILGEYLSSTSHVLRTHNQMIPSKRDARGLWWKPDTGRHVPQLSAVLFSCKSLLYSS